MNEKNKTRLKKNKQKHSLATLIGTVHVLTKKDSCRVQLFPNLTVLLCHT